MAMDKMDKKEARRGHPQSEETRQKISKANSGRVLSDDTKEKISKSMMGNTNGRGNRKEK